MKFGNYWFWGIMLGGEMVRRYSWRDLEKVWDLMKTFHFELGKISLWFNANVGWSNGGDATNYKWVQKINLKKESLWRKLTSGVREKYLALEEDKYLLVQKINTYWCNKKEKEYRNLAFQLQ